MSNAGSLGEKIDMQPPCSACTCFPIVPHVGRGGAGTRTRAGLGPESTSPATMSCWGTVERGRGSAMLCPLVLDSFAA